MDSVMKVTFPAYSRMQDHKEELSKGIEKTLFFVSLAVFPMLVGILVLAKPLVFLIPKYSKWEVALLALYLFIINSAFGALTTPLTNALNAIGRIKIVFKLMIMWTVLTWVIYPFLAIKYGANGVALGAAIVSLSSIVAIWVAKRYLIFNFFKSIIKPTVAAILMGLLILILGNLLVKNILTVLILIMIGSLFYFGLIYTMVGKQFITDAKKLFYAFKNR
jgi:O-antigen/teichoic acid export membrane protein